MNSPFEKVIEAEYDLLLGKRTYDMFAAYWPNHRDIPIGERFQRINTLADCAAAPSLFNADWVEPFGPARPRLSA